ncbi:MAG: LLM class flavin-dependent oxidoreductase, partial [Hyphomonadaceae bacterium]
MHIGYATTFQNPNRMFSDKEVWENEIAFCMLAEKLGLDSIWSTEHHFTDYEMIPSPVQFLTYVAGRTTRMKLGTMVIVLPWHDPVRVASEINMLEHVSDGRMILGLGRGLATVEFEGFRINMEESRERFTESLQTVLESLETGQIYANTKHYKIPRRDIRPDPLYSFQGRTFVAGASKETMPLAARLGCGWLIIPTSTFAEIDKNLSAYKEAFAEAHPGKQHPKPLLDQFVFVDKDAGRAKDMAYKHIGTYYREILKHYNMAGDHFKDTKGYEHYAAQAAKLQANTEAVIEQFLAMQSWGTPDQVIEKFRAHHQHLGMATCLIHFFYGGMSRPDGEANLTLFAKEVMPELKKWGQDQFL